MVGATVAPFAEKEQKHQQKCEKYVMTLDSLIWPTSLVRYPNLLMTIQLLGIAL